MGAGEFDPLASAPLSTGFPLDNNAVFVQQQSAFADRWFLTVGLRVDSKESYDTFVSPKLSAGGFVVPSAAVASRRVKVFGNIGKGIKSPNFFERFGAGFADPTPDLKVEEARTGDIGVEATFATQRVRGARHVLQQRLQQSGRLPVRPGGRRHPRVHQHRWIRGERLGARRRTAAAGARVHRRRQLLVRRHGGGDQPEHEPAVPARSAAAATAKELRFHSCRVCGQPRDRQLRSAHGGRSARQQLSVHCGRSRTRSIRRRSRPTSRSIQATPWRDSGSTCASIEC